MNDNGTPAAAGAAPWGRVTTFFLGFIALLGAQSAGLVVLTWWYGQSVRDLPNLSGDGVGVTLIIFASTAVQVTMLVLFVRMRGADVAEYLGLRMPRRADLMFGIAAIVAFIVIGNTLSWLLGRNVVTDFQSDIFRTASAAGWLPLLLIAVVLVTPIGEELLFRGFLFQGWLRTPRDTWPVIVVTALLFALMHVQYDWYVMSHVFVFGMLQGWLRWCTGSTLLCVFLHALVNLEGMLETFVSLQWHS